MTPQEIERQVATSSGASPAMINSFNTPNSMQKAQSFSQYTSVGRKRQMQGCASTTNLLQMKEGKKTAAQLLKEKKNMKLRNEILTKLEIEALPCNRLEHDYNVAQFNSLMVSFAQR